MNFDTDSIHKYLLENKINCLPDVNHIEVFNQIDSTNTECKRRLEQTGQLIFDNGEFTEEGFCLHKKVIVASEQTAGRGRLGRVFYSPDKTGIYFSIIYIPTNNLIINPSEYTVTAAVCVCRTIEKIFGITTQIKWVNDIYINNKKICGILTEGVTDTNGRIKAAIIGIGINIEINNTLPQELRNKAGGIIDNLKAQNNNKSLNIEQNIRIKLLTNTINELITSLDNNENIIDEYKRHSMLTGKIVTVTPIIGDEKTKYSATVIDITDKAELIVRDDNNKIILLHSGEVTLH